MSSLPEQLAALGKLHTDGLLTEQEYTLAKQQLLGAPASAEPAAAPAQPVAAAAAVPVTAAMSAVPMPPPASPAPANAAPATTGMSPRLRRLQADYEKMMTAFAGHPTIAVEAAAPVPPDRYRVVYTVPGLHLTPTNELVRVGQHVVEITLPSGYPREKPYCTTSAPVFHPNFGNYICIADFWSPGQALADVVVQIGDMLQFKLYNTRSPLNATAAKWAVENIASLPLGAVELLPMEPEIVLAGAARSAVATAAGPRYEPAVQSTGDDLPAFAQDHEGGQSDD